MNSNWCFEKSMQERKERVLVISMIQRNWKIQHNHRRRINEHRKCINKRNKSIGATKNSSHCVSLVGRACKNRKK